jgi:uncharacterized membrane-anchored protein
MSFRSALRRLVVLALGLPLIEAVLFWVAALLKAMGDSAGSHVVQRINLGVGVVWIVSLAALVVVLGLKNLNDPP